MINESSRHGERIATLESRFADMLSRMDHLDECVDDVKSHAASNFSAVQAKLSQWDSRWKVALGIIVGMIIMAGSGTVSLKTLLDLLAKIH